MKICNLVENIPKFINKYSLDIRNKIYTNFGDFNINQFYDVNEFVYNSENNLFKVDVEIYLLNTRNESTKENRYIIITDVNFLIFSPCQLKCCHKNKAKLIYSGHLKELSSL